jgi:hypothetical protein
MKRIEEQQAENGFDGEKDGQWEQAGRAIPGALGMGLATIYGGAADMMDTAWSMTPWGD